jgi:precorrin-6Y C5,15-methyltransferase (decarboxylating)
VAEPIAVLGTTDAGPAALTPEARRILGQATLVAGGTRHLALFAAAIPNAAQRIELTSSVDQSIDELDQAEGTVVVLASGDPLLFGIGASLVRRLGRERVRFHPAPSSVQLAFAAAGEPWHDAIILSAHGRELASIVPQAMAATRLAILTDHVSTPSAVARALIDAGMEDCRAIVAERLGGPCERVVETTLRALTSHEFDPLTVLLLVRDPSSPRLSFGRPDEQFDSVRGQITKAEVRAVTLSKLRLPPAGVLWDIGAGSGALAIEAAALMPRGAVYAIERDPEQQACLARNVGRHAATNVHIVAAEAPAALHDLPRPDAVFLGGNGGGLLPLLEAVPRPFVTNLAMIEHVSTVLQRFPEAEATQLSVARSQPIGDGHRLAALNPVFIVTVPA